MDIFSDSICIYQLRLSKQRTRTKSRTELVYFLTGFEELIQTLLSILHT